MQRVLAKRNDAFAKALQGLVMGAEKVQQDLEGTPEVKNIVVNELAILENRIEAAKKVLGGHLNAKPGEVDVKQDIVALRDYVVKVRGLQQGRRPGAAQALPGSAPTVSVPASARSRLGEAPPCRNFVDLRCIEEHGSSQH